jgi:hypothetical protein
LPKANKRRKLTISAVIANYSRNDDTMPRYVLIVDGLFLVTLFLVAPAISAVIGYAAWKGRPYGFSRTKYWMMFVSVMAVSFFLMVYAQRLRADVRTLQYAWQAACFELGALLFGIAGGCAVAVFTYRRTQRAP